MPEVTFRRAQTGDREATAGLLRKVDPQDWLLEILEQALDLDPGGIYLAEAGQDLVAASMIAFPRTREAGLSAMRVDPERRRQGLATKFTQFLLGEAGRLGAGVSRLLVEQDNEASHGLVRKVGLEETAEWCIVGSLDLGHHGPASGVGEPGRRNLSQVRQYFTRHLRQTNPGGLISSRDLPWELHALDWSHLQEAVGDRLVALRYGSQGADGALILGQDRARSEPHLFVRYLDGEKTARENLLRYLSRRAGELGATVGASLPQAQAAGLFDLLSQEPPAYRFTVYEWRYDPGDG